jgi:hypothetical protein
MLSRRPQAKLIMSAAQTASVQYPMSARHDRATQAYLLHNSISKNQQKKEKKEEKKLPRERKQPLGKQNAKKQATH